MAYLAALLVWTVALAAHDGVDLFGFGLGVGCGIIALTLGYWFCWLVLMLIEDCL